MSPTERAERAQRILDDEVFRDMLEEIRMGLVASLETLPMGDIDTQHVVALQLQLLRQMRTRLASYGNQAALDRKVAKESSFRAKMLETYSSLRRPGAATS